MSRIKEAIRQLEQSKIDEKLRRERLRYQQEESARLIESQREQKRALQIPHLRSIAEQSGLLQTITDAAEALSGRVSTYGEFDNNDNLKHLATRISWNDTYGTGMAGNYHGWNYVEVFFFPNGTVDFHQKHYGLFGHNRIKTVRIQKSQWQNDPSIFDDNLLEAIKHPSFDVSHTDPPQLS